MRGKVYRISMPGLAFGPIFFLTKRRQTMGPKSRPGMLFPFLLHSFSLRKRKWIRRNGRNSLIAVPTLVTSDPRLAASNSLFLRELAARLGGTWSLSPSVPQDMHVPGLSSFFLVSLSFSNRKRKEGRGHSIILEERPNGQWGWRLTQAPPRKRKERCSGSYRQAVGFLVIKDDSISERPS